MKTGRGNLASGVVNVCHEWEVFEYQNHRLIGLSTLCFPMTLGGTMADAEGRVWVHRSTVQHSV